MYSLARWWWWPFLERFVKAWCKERGGKCSPGNDNPETATACRLWRSAAECSCALRLNSATDDVLGSDDDELDVHKEPGLRLDWAVIGSLDILAHVVTVDVDDVGVLVIGQHEHKPGKPSKRKMRKMKIHRSIKIPRWQKLIKFDDWAMNCFKSKLYNLIMTFREFKLSLHWFKSNLKSID